MLQHYTHYTMLRTVRNVFFRWFALLFFPSPVSIKNNDDAIVLELTMTRRIEIAA